MNASLAPFRSLACLLARPRRRRRTESGASLRRRRQTPLAAEPGGCRCVGRDLGRWSLRRGRTGALVGERAPHRGRLPPVAGIAVPSTWFCTSNRGWLPPHPIDARFDSAAPPGVSAAGALIALRSRRVGPGRQPPPSGAARRHVGARRRQGRDRMEAGAAADLLQLGSRRSALAATTGLVMRMRKGSARPSCKRNLLDAAARTRARRGDSR